MKKIKFNYLDMTSGYNENKNPKVEVKKMEGYYFRVFDYHFVVHKYVYESGCLGGWRVTELTSGAGVTQLMPTRKKAMECFVEMQKQKYNGLDFFVALKQRVAKTIETYGKANDIKTSSTQYFGNLKVLIPTAERM